jgi:hypothetical protein
MMSPEASDLAWIFVVKPPRERPSACPSCPLLLRRPTHARARWSSRTSGSDARTNSSRRARRRRLRKRQPCSAGRSASIRCSKDRNAPAKPATDVFDGEEMKPFEEAPVVFGFPASPGKARAKHRQRVRPIYLIHPCRHAPRSPNQPETYESRPIQLRNPKKLIHPKFVHTA